MQYSAYQTLVCLIVFLLLGGLSVFAITLIVRMQVRLIRLGGEDVRLLSEEMKRQSKKTSYAIGRVVERILSLVLCVVLLTVLFLSLASQYGVASFGDLPSFRVVKSSSMSEKHEKNKYLFEHDLNDQFGVMDLVLTQKLPGEFELELYDIVVYEVDGTLIIHRIVGIEEPNAKHPDCRHFVLQGDAIPLTDKVPVLYSQMKAIYTGQRFANIGSFVAFFQAPAGWMCILAVVIYAIATPFVQKNVGQEVSARLAILAKERAELYGTPLPKEQEEEA